jgi:hypothetical protein
VAFSGIYELYEPMKMRFFDVTNPAKAIEDAVSSSLGSIIEYSSMFMMLSNDDLLALISFLIILHIL